MTEEAKAKRKEEIRSMRGKGKLFDFDSQYCNVAHTYLSLNYS